MDNFLEIKGITKIQVLRPKTLSILYPLFNVPVMLTINLTNLIFYAFHGVHEEERILGNEFEVNVALSFEATELITELEHTINYASVYELVKQRMAIPAALLETLAQDLTQKIYSIDNRIRSISVKIEKKNPPIPNIQGTVGVTYYKEF